MPKDEVRPKNEDRPKNTGNYGLNGNTFHFENHPSIGKRKSKEYESDKDFDDVHVDELSVLKDCDDEEALKLFKMNFGEHPHVHYTTRQSWLRAAVLGSYDGLVSISSLIMGVAAGYTGAPEDMVSSIMLTGVSGIVAGSLSMAVGEFTSVQLQSESERADVEREREEQKKGPIERTRELVELAKIWRNRGLSPNLALKVACELSKKEAWKSHARDELNIDVERFSNPIAASLASMSAFCIGVLALMGAVSALIGGSKIWIATIRMVFAGLAALSVTYGAGLILGGTQL